MHLQQGIYKGTNCIHIWVRILLMCNPQYETGAVLFQNLPHKKVLKTVKYQKNGINKITQ